MREHNRQQTCLLTYIAFLYNETGTKILPGDRSFANDGDLVWISVFNNLDITISRPMLTVKDRAKTREGLGGE